MANRLIHPDREIANFREQIATEREILLADALRKQFAATRDEVARLVDSTCLAPANNTPMPESWRRAILALVSLAAIHAFAWGICWISGS